MSKYEEFCKRAEIGETNRFKAEIQAIAESYYKTDMDEKTYTELLNKSSKRHDEAMKQLREQIFPIMKKNFEG